MKKIYNFLMPKFLCDFDAYLLRNYPLVWQTKVIFVLFYSIIGIPLLHLEGGNDFYYFFLVVGICYWAYRQHQMGFPFTRIKDTLLTLLLYGICFGFLLWLTMFDARYWSNPNDWAALFGRTTVFSLIFYFIPFFPFEHWSFLAIALALGIAAAPNVSPTLTNSEATSKDPKEIAISTLPPNSKATNKDPKEIATSTLPPNSEPTSKDSKEIATPTLPPNSGPTSEDSKVIQGLLLFMPLLSVILLSIAAYKKKHPTALIFCVSLLFVNLFYALVVELLMGSSNLAFYGVQVLGVLGAVLTTYVRTLPKG
jgi:hypothetical protein